MLSQDTVEHSFALVRHPSILVGLHLLTADSPFMSTRAKGRSWRYFEPWRCARTAKAHALVDDVIRYLTAREKDVKPRKRERRPDDHQTFVATVEAITCDLAHLHLSQPGSGQAGIAVPLTKRVLGARPRRYRPPAFNTKLRGILDGMRGGAFLGLEVGDQTQWSEVFIPGEFMGMRKSQPTTIWPGVVLVDRIEHNGVTLDDLGTSDIEEVILLKGHKPDRGEEGPPDEEPKAPLMDYVDDATTRRMRNEVREINAWLASADLRLAAGDPDEPLSERQALALATVDLSKRTLKRHFTRESFVSGGRLFGAWWLVFPKSLRHRLRIEGEPTATLDFVSLYPRLAYLRASISPPRPDLYQIEGIDRQWRDGIKRLINARLFDHGPRKSKPKRTEEEIAEGKQVYPPKMSVGKMLALIEAAHPDIKRHFGTSIGHSLQFTESQLMVALLLALKRAGCVGLPLHDAVVCRVSHVDQVRGIMLEVSREIVGQALLVSPE